MDSTYPPDSVTASVAITNIMSPPPQLEESLRMYIITKANYLHEGGSFECQDNHVKCRQVHTGCEHCERCNIARLRVNDANGSDVPVSQQAESSLPCIRTEDTLAIIFTRLLLFGFCCLSFATYSIAPKWTHSSVRFTLKVVQYPREVDEAICWAGTLGMCFTWLRQKGQPNWLVNHLFYPGFLNSVVGMFVAALVTSESAAARNPSRLVDISSTSTGAIQILPVLPDLSYPLVITGLSTLVWGTLTCVYGMMGYPSHNYEVPDICTDEKSSCNNCKG